MRLLEFEAKQLLAKHRIGVPRGSVAKTAAEAEGIASELGGPVAIKGQYFSRWRNQAGGIKFADSPAAAKQAAEELLAHEIKGAKPTRLLVEEKVAIAKEFAIHATYDAVVRRPVLVASDAGGQDTDALKYESPDRVKERHLSSLLPIEAQTHTAKLLAKDLGFSGRQLNQATSLASNLADLFLRYDFTVAEINSLALTEDGKFVALDGYMNLEVEAKPRQEEMLAELQIEDIETRGSRPLTAFELECQDIDATDPRGIIGPVAQFGGDMGLVIGAGGGSITTYDAITRHGGKPADYCAIGGNPSVKKAERLTKAVLSLPGVDKICVISNVVSNTRADLLARGVIKGVLAMGKEPKDTITIFRSPGAWEADAFKILEKYGINYADRTMSLSDAAKIAVDKAKG